MTQSPSFQRGLKAPIAAAPPRPHWYATDNGFQSPFTMDVAHKPIVDLAARTLSGRAGNILDLGCGNGVLLRKICEASPGRVPFGLDIDPERIAHAREILPAFVENFLCGNMLEEERIWAAGRRYDLVILMPGRLVEAGPERVPWFRERVVALAENVLVYAYGDWLTRFNTLGGLAQAAGLRLLDSDPEAKAGLAVFGTAARGAIA